MVKRCFGADLSDRPLDSFLERTERDRFLVRVGMMFSDRERDGARDGVREGGPGYAGGGGGGGGGFVGYAKGIARSVWYRVAEKCKVKSDASKEI